MSGSNCQLQRAVAGVLRHDACQGNERVTDPGTTDEARSQWPVTGATQGTSIRPEQGPTSSQQVAGGEYDALSRSVSRDVVIEEAKSTSYRPYLEQSLGLVSPIEWLPTVAGIVGALPVVFSWGLNPFRGETMAEEAKNERDLMGDGLICRGEDTTSGDRLVISTVNHSRVF